MLHRTFVLGLILTFIPTFAVAQQGAYGTPTIGFPEHGAALGLSGSVRTADDKPARDARIEVMNISTGKVLADTYTNENGTFDISNIPNGSYEVRAVAGLNEVHDRVDLGSTGAVVNLRFPPADATAAEAGARHTVSVAQMKVPSKARDAFKKAQAAMGKQNLEEAAKYVEAALGIHPEYSEALALRGVLKLDAGHADAALDDLDHAIKIDSGNSLAYVAMGAAFNSLLKYDDALRNIDRGIAIAPTMWQGYFEMGKAFLGKGNYEAALRQLNKAETLGPKEYPLIHLVKAHALLGMKNYSEAMAELQWFLEKAPADQNSAKARQTLDKVRAFAATVPGK